MTPRQGAPGDLAAGAKEEQPIQAKEVELELTLTDKVD
jgi:hypothetical protein